MSPRLSEVMYLTLESLRPAKSLVCVGVLVRSSRAHSTLLHGSCDSALIVQTRTDDPTRCTIYLKGRLEPWRERETHGVMLNPRQVPSDSEGQRWPAAILKKCALQGF